MPFKGEPMNPQELRQIFENLALTVVREVVGGLAEAVIDATPVKSGALSGGWQLSLSGTVDAPHGRLGRQAAKADLSRVLSSYTRVNSTDKITFSNSIYYAFFVEFGTRKMAPRHFVLGALSKWESICAKAAVKAQFVASPPTKI